MNDSTHQKQQPSNISHSHSSIRSIEVEEEEGEGISGHYQKVVYYKECLKNHAAHIGGNAIDGCGEFIPDPFQKDVMRCSACNCHRNFHRKVTVHHDANHDYELGANNNSNHYYYYSKPLEEEEKKGNMVRRRKRFRTKFTPEQKEKMLRFADKAGWKIQKVEDCVVEQFCMEIGIKRRVLKVWMHNNKKLFL